MTKGIITIATPDFIESAKLLALSANKFSNLPTTLVTTEPIEAEEFDKIIIAPGDVYNAFAVGLLSTPYKQTAFMYADSLVLSDITDYFSALDKVDIVTPNAIDYKGLPLPTELFLDRKMIRKNNLPDAWTNFFLYNVEGVHELLSVLPNVLNLWDHGIESAFTDFYTIDADIKNKINVSFSIAMRVCGVTHNSYGTKFTNLSKQTNNLSLRHLADKDWHQLLSFWATEDKKVKIENFNQTGVVHYTKTWLNDSKSKSIRELCS